MTEARSWNAPSYHAVSGPMVEMATRVLARLDLRGDETVIDAGCGTGRVTALLLERLPSGRVIALDADGDMVRVARETLAGFGDRVTVDQRNLLELDLVDAADAVLSTATFHWVPDHDLLFDNLFRALRPGGALVAQCGGFGNNVETLRAVDAVAGRGSWREFFDGWRRPMRYETAEATAARLHASGFTDVRCWLEPNPVTPDDPHEYLSTIILGAHTDRLPLDRRSAFVEEVVAEMPAPVTIDYVRLNIDARKPR